MLTKSTLTLFFGIIFVQSNAQQAWFRTDTTTAVTVNGKVITNPWAGGLNASQFSKMRLNNDDIEDLVVYDRTSGKITTFVADEDSNEKRFFKHAPYYESLFPAIDNWMLLVDYNKDGHKDLFASTPLGIMVYKQIRAANAWSWQLVSDAIYTKGLSGAINLQVSGTDIPGIVDIDDDGDLDIITFDFSGTYIELHQNLSMETYGVPDSLGTTRKPVYARNGDCWGNFHKNAVEDGFIFGDDCGVKDLSGGRIFHSGNSIMLNDLDGDGKKDLLVGHISSDNLSIIKNSAKGIVANFTSSSPAYPAVDPVIFHIFPAAFMEDVDFDGVKDLIAATNVSSNDNNMTDFKSSNWYYHNSGTTDNPKFNLVQKNFLQDQMIDVGENSSPSFYDIDGDGKQDMIIGTGGVPGSNGFRGALWYMRNTGTATAPAYELTSDNYMNLPATYDAYNIKPQWADFNGDGVPDLGFATSSFKGLEFRYIPNKGKKGEAAQLSLADAIIVTLPSELITSDTPFFYDGDKDGDLDLLIGGAQGNVSYYTNNGSVSKPVFTLETNSFAGLNISFEGRSVQVSVADMDLDGKADLLTVDQTGNLRIFHSADWGKWATRESFLIERDGKGAAGNFGEYLFAATADYNGDGKPDIAVGSNLGGINLLTNILPITITGTEPPSKLEVNVFPNPADRFIRVSTSQNVTMDVFTVNGTRIMQDVFIAGATVKEIPTLNWSPGLYLLELKNGKTKEVKKIVVK